MHDHLQALSVSALTALIKKTLEEGFYGLTVHGEISNFRPSSTGHWFFTLKDESASISAVMFKASTWRVDFKPKEGDRVEVTGSLDLYAARGTYQIKVEAMTLSGYGEILAELERRKRLFAEKGYFASEKKRPLPPYPRRVGVVTSPTGAALKDILTVLARRAPAIEVLVLPAVVQGDSAAESVALRIRQANALMLCDVLIIARGGGSTEDLLPFSDEVVVKAVAESSIPTISGVGHEIDFALVDWAADLRAPTPSAAAELASASSHALQQAVKGYGPHLIGRIEARLALAEAQLRRFDSAALLHRIDAALDSKQFVLANAANAMTASTDRILASAQETLRVLQGRLHALSPLAILSRGYVVVTDRDGTVIARKADAIPGSEISLRFIDGSRRATIEEDL